MRRGLMLALLGLLIACPWAGGEVRAGRRAQTPSTGVPQAAPTFRAEIDFVEIHAIVTNRRGEFVEDLDLDDFEVYENGVLQTPSVFSLVSVPVGRSGGPVDATAAPEPDVCSSTRPSDGRVFALVLDDLHTGFEHSQFVREVVSRFVREHLGDQDLAAVVYTSGRDDAAQEVTGSRQRLLTAIGKFQGRRLPSAGAEKLAIHLRERQGGALLGGSTGDFEEVRTVEGLHQAQSIRDPQDAERGMNARRTLQLVEQVARTMGAIQGRRKAMLLFSEGIDYDIYDPFNRGSASAVVSYAQAAVAAAQRANVSVYGIDIRGALSSGVEAVGIGGLSVYPHLGFGTARGFIRELLLAQESLISLSQQTGGLALINTIDPQEALNRVVLDNSAFYLIGYRGDPSDRPGQFRSIEIKVKTPGLQVRARRGYVPADGRRRAPARGAEAASGTTQALTAALGLPVSVGDVPLRVFSAPFMGSGGKASVLVTVEVDGQALTFEPREGRFAQTLEVAIAAVDHRSRLQGGDRQTFKMNLRADTLERVRRTGIRFMSRLDLPPARYQIRVGAHQVMGGAIGTVPCDLDVPDFTTRPLALGGVVLSSVGAASLVTTAEDPTWQGMFPAPPAATRAFSADDTLMLLVEAYAGPNPLSREIDFVATVWRAEDERPLVTTRDSWRAEASGGWQTHRFFTRIPLNDFSPGGHVLQVELRSTVGDAIQRLVPFEVQTPGR